MQIESATEVTGVVWWALLLGGFLGGVIRILRSGIELPYVKRFRRPDRIVIIPGFISDLLLGPAAAFALLGAVAATFKFQTAYTSEGFWAPFLASMIAGAGAAEVIDALVSQRLQQVEASLFDEAERVIGSEGKENVEDQAR